MQSSAKYAICCYRASCRVWITMWAWWWRGILWGACSQLWVAAPSQLSCCIEYVTGPIVTESNNMEFVYRQACFGDWWESEVIIWSLHIDKLALVHDENLKFVLCVCVCVGFWIGYFWYRLDSVCCIIACLPKLTMKCLYHVWLAAQAELCMVKGPFGLWLTMSHFN